MSSNEWKAIYTNFVNLEVDVSKSFDWKLAAVFADRTNNELVATCTWSNQKVRIIAPWKEIKQQITHTTTKHNSDNAIVIDSGLITGVIRDMHISAISQGICISFTYDEAFRLRGIRESCKKRGEVQCKNCVKRKMCLNPKYAYFITKIATSSYVNDSLCMRVRKVVDTIH